MWTDKLKRVVLGGGLVAVGLFLFASLLSHNPHEGPMADFPPGGAGIHNVCGAVGAWISAYALMLFGWLSGVLAAAFLLCGIFFLTGLPRHRWSAKATGIVLAVFALALALGFPHVSGESSWGPTSLSSGVLGVMLTRWLYTTVGWAGSLGLMAVSFAGAAVLLAGGPLTHIWSQLPNWISAIIERLQSVRLPKPATAGAGAGGSSVDVSSSPKEDRKSQGKTASATTQTASTQTRPTKSREEPTAASEPEPDPEPVAESEPEPEPAPEPAEDVESPVESEDDEEAGPEIVARYDEGGHDESGFGKAMKKRATKVKFDDKDFDLPSLDLLDAPEDSRCEEDKKELRKRGKLLEKTLEEFNIDARVVRVQRGPVVTMYEMALAAGTKVSKVESLDDDMAIALKAPNVRIVAPIPGKSTVGIEVPNENREIVRLRELLGNMSQKTADMAIPLFLGKDTAGSPLIVDLAKAPHLLIAGATGSGKSVALNSIISSILMTRTPLEAQLLLMDPKSVEFSDYKNLPHLICPILTDMKKAAGVLQWACKKMDERFSMLGQVNVRNIHEYNKLGRKEIVKRLDPEDEAEVDDVPFYMPHTVIVVDELGELMMVAAKDVESSIIRLSQKARAVGIHLICATQRPSADVITGLIKANLPARIAFQVSSKVNSRVILDRNGAELLLGQGDMLMQPPASSRLVRAQGTFVSQQETQKLVKFLGQQAEPHFKDELRNLNAASDPQDHDDDLYEEAVRIVLETQRGSVSLLQRRLAIGYTRAARLIDMMAEAGIVGSHRGSKAREVMLTLEEWEEARKNA